MYQKAQYMVMYIGIDLHKYYMQVAVLDGDGNLTEEIRIKNDTGHVHLGRFLDRMDPRARIALESSSVWRGVFTFVRKRGFDIVLSNPIQTKLIAHARIKTDKVDARILAKLLYTDFLPICTVKTEKQTEASELARHRKYLVRSRTDYKNKIQGILLMMGIRTQNARFTKKHMDELYGLKNYRITSYLKVIETLTGQIKEADKRIAETVDDVEDRNSIFLASIPGVGYYSALVIASEIGDISRFPDADHLKSYAGLVPSTYSSGGKTRHGGITKNGSSFLRSVLSECILSHRRVCKNSTITETYDRIAYKKGTPKATVAASAKLLKYCYWILKEQREYIPELHDPRPALKSRKTTVNTVAS